MILPLGAWLLCCSPGRGLAATAYWDGNGADPGAGAAPAGTWGTSLFWNLIADGTGTPGAWTAGDVAVFSAGADATDAFTVTVSGTQTAAGIEVEEGTVTLATGTVSLGAGYIKVEPGATLSTDSSLRISATAGSTITVNGGTLRTTNPGAAGTFYDADFAVTLGPLGGTFSHTTTNILNIVQTAMTVSGPGSLTKTGPGALAIAGTCSYLGSTIINEGEIRIRSSANRLPVTTAVVVNRPGILNLNGIAQRIGSLSGDGDVGIAGTASQTLTVGDDTSTTFSGALKNIANAGAGGGTTGVGRVLKLGTGTLTLTGTNTYTGTLTISNGAVTLAPNAMLCDPICDLVVQGGALNLNNAAQTVLSLAGGGGTVNLGAGHTLTVNPTSGTKSFYGTMAGDGDLVKSGAGTTGLFGDNTYSGLTTISAGALLVGSPNALGGTSAGTTVAGGASLLFDGPTNSFAIAEPVSIAGAGTAALGSAIFIQNSANITISGPVTLAGDATIGVSGTGTGLYNHPTAITATADQNLTLQGGAGAGGGGTIAGVINLGAGGLTKLQGGRWTLTEANLYSGPTLVSAGTLRVANTSGSATGSGAVTVNSGATLSGPGIVAGPVTLNGAIAPGASAGALTTGEQTWNGGGSYVWEINDADAGAGADPGWDLLAINGTLTIAATPASKFTLRLASLTPANTAGPVHDFSSSTEYFWTIVQTTEGIVGFDPAAFTLNSASFSNALDGRTFMLELANGGKDLVLHFTGVPVATDLPAMTRQDTPLVLSLAKILGSAYDPDGDPLTVVAVSPLSLNGGAVTLGPTAVTYTPVSGFTGPDSFSYTVTDGRGGFATAQVLVTVVPGSGISANLVSLVPGPGGNLLTFAGLPGYTYTIERAETPVGPWTALGPATTGSNGIGTYLDAAPPPGSAFYRTVYP